MADCRQHGVAVAFVLIPDQFQVEEDVLATALAARRLRREEVDLSLPQRRLLRFCRDRGAACLDLLPVFAGRKGLYALRDTHWSVAGNRLAARQIAQWLERLDQMPRLRQGGPPAR